MSSLKPLMYVYHLPYEERKTLCYILDQDNKWEELGLQMRFDDITLDTIKKEILKGNSPSNELLNMWGHLNHNVLELFVLLNRMGLYQGMALLRSFVDVKYHGYIKEDNVNKDIKQNVPDSKVPSINFDKDSNKNVRKKAYSNEDNETSSLPQTVEKPTHLLANNLNNTPNFPRLQAQRDPIKVLSACVALKAGATPQIPYDELELATDSWNPNRILGRGGFGIVFKGTWKLTQVAIKRLETKGHTEKDFTDQIRQSVTELHCLNAYRHDNVLPLYGYSIGGPHPCLVYQFMPGGSLEGRIRTKDKTKVLSWPTRVQIATGTARGLQFLHTTLHANKPLIHGDIKSANILLDLMDQPRIGDFGLAREGPERHYTHIQLTRVHGTVPYLPEDFRRSRQVSTKVDTYSFGVVLFELATSYPPVIGNNKEHLRDYVLNYPKEHILQLKDAKAEGGDLIFEELVRIGIACVQKRAKDRPEMVSVLLMLENVSQLLSVEKI